MIQFNISTVVKGSQMAPFPKNDHFHRTKFWVTKAYPLSLKCVQTNNYRNDTMLNAFDLDWNTNPSRAS